MFDWIKRSTQTEHRFCQDNLSPFLDKELTPREQTRVARHLDECVDCRADLASLRRTVAVLHAVPALKPPRTFFIPASEGVRQKQVRRSRVAYGYLQFATAVATVLLLLVVSGDAVLRSGVGQPAHREMAPTVESIALDRQAGAPEPPPTSALAFEAPVTGLTQAPAPAPTGVPAVPAVSAEPTAVAPLAQPPPSSEAGQAGTTTAVVDEAVGAAKAAPSLTFARPAGAPLLPTPTQGGGLGASPGTVLVTPEPTAAPVSVTAVPPTPVPAPTDTPVPPTAIPLPTATPVPPTATPLPAVEPTSAPAAPVELVRREPPPPPPADRWQWLRSTQPLLPWLEWILGALVAVLLVATLWLRRKQRTT